MKKELPKTYSPSEFEDRLYKFWDENGFFSPSDDHTKKPFSIVIPPPNVTGQLHMGHALNNTLQDIIIRTKRMQGYNTLWIPGTDHAGIATQIKVESQLRAEKGLTRHDIGREAFLELVWAWKEQYGSRIINQLKKMGSSCDWTRERFTMDSNLSAAVRKTFVKLYSKGLIYRGLRIINRCPSCATALSDAEIEHRELEGAFWHIAYQVKDSDERMIVATTRPETMLGDTGVAVNPADERYMHLIGKTLILPLVGREIPVFADEYVDREFGTGCVKVTPGHDPNDFDMGARHGLEIINILNDDASINENGGKYAGLGRFEARKAVVADLEALGCLIKIEKHAHNVGHCYRCGTVVEPIASKQWFVEMKTLSEPAIKVVKTGEINYIPDRFSKIYLNWMENIHDWCISRQLWWGHRIPAFYCSCGEMTVSETDITVCPKCGSSELKQDDDVLDTWFSSALWPFSTLGWPEKTDELAYFYPTSVLVTAYDIITFWVSKMIFMGIENMEQIPFPNVFIHGLIRDAQNRKMSKSLGNGIDPLELIDQYGADALRFALATGNSPGNDMRFSDEKIESARNFNNKIWNAARFVLMNLDIDRVELPPPAALAAEDKWLLTRYNILAGEISVHIDNYEIGIALGKLYDFIWDIFCDWYIELVKPRLSAGNSTAQHVITYVFSNSLKLLHPYLPFITEEIWQSLPHTAEEEENSHGSIMMCSYPGRDEQYLFPVETANMEMLITCIRSIRNRRAEMNVPPSRKAKLIIVSDKKEIFSEDTVSFFTKLASVSSVTVCDYYSDEDAVQIITDAATLYIPLADMIDFEKERERLKKERDQALSEISRIEKKLSNEGFTAKAPQAVIEGEREKLRRYRDTLEGIEKALEK
ncbi:MAG: valine--tRNA ligase [Eubacteriales bacterium]